MTLKRTLCQHCKKRLEQGQKIHPDCIEPWAQAQEDKAKRKDKKRAREAAKVEREETRQRKAKMKRIPDLIREADQAFAAFIRERDRQAGYPCISSGRPLEWTGNAVDAGHYRSRGAASHLRYDERNCHAQSKHDNMYAAGNVVEYRMNLINRIGQEMVDELEADNTPHKWKREELIEIKRKYRLKLRELKESK